jgi:hypothetical protein
MMNGLVPILNSVSEDVNTHHSIFVAIRCSLGSKKKELRVWAPSVCLSVTNYQ